MDHTGQDIRVPCLPHIVIPDNVKISCKLTHNILDSSYSTHLEYTHFISCLLDKFVGQLLKSMSLSTMPNKNDSKYD